MKLSVGNTTANLIANSIIVSLANATATANLQPTQLVIGTSTVNTTAVLGTTLVGGATTVNTTQIVVGGSTTNVVWHVGNDGSGSGLDADLLDGHDTSYFSNATVFSSGSTVANATGVYVGANLFVDTVKLSIGNTTANATANSIIHQIANSTATTNVTPDGIKVGSTSIVNTAGHFGNGSGLTSILQANNADNLGTIPASHYGQTAIVAIVGTGAAAMTVGQYADVLVPFSGTITQVTLLADRAGNTVIEIRKCTYSQFDDSTHPVTGDKINASAPPTISSSATKSQDATLTGWTTSISVGDILRFYVNSAATMQQCSIILNVNKT